MIRKTLFAAAFVMTAMAISASAQKAPDMSGTWMLDVARSKMAMPVESMTMTVTQTEADLSVKTETKRAPQTGVEAPRGGGARGGGGFGGDSSYTYSLDGKDKNTQSEGPMGPIPVTLKAKFDGGKLKLSQTRNFDSPMGSITMVTKETWEMGTDGGLTVTRESQTPRGNNTSTLVFTKKN
ncbi:MAG: hypothetical protein IPM50_11225 [Acidobacteriota bacterium]|nr:MAG: hypothetical protein IPM50_11225 [Acidobacteriota bacterium]